MAGRRTYYGCRHADRFSSGNESKASGLPRYHEKGNAMKSKPGDTEGLLIRTQQVPLPMFSVTNVRIGMKATLGRIVVVAVMVGICFLFLQPTQTFAAPQ